MKAWVKLGLVALVSLGIFWAPFLGRTKSLWGVDFAQQGMETIVQNFDGLNFLVIAKSWYDPKIIERINAQFLTGNQPIYFTAHFPVLPILIKALDVVLPAPHALLLAIALTNAALGIALYAFFGVTLKNKQLVILLSCMALFFPARMLSTRAVGSNEPLFISLVLGSLLWATKGKHWGAAIMGALAVLTRSPGILLFGAYAWQWLTEQGTWTSKTKKYLPYLLMPAALIGLFGFYGWRYQDPLAYFHSGDNLHLFFPPFQIFSNMQSWINDMWREDIIYLYAFYGAGILLVNEQWSVIKKWGLVYGTMLLFVAHRDLARYALPLAPLSLLGYAPLLEKVPKRLWWLGATLLIPIYLLGWQFVLRNIQPINDWGVFL